MVGGLGGVTYVELLPEELAIVSRAEPELFLLAVHGDGEVGPGGRGGSGEQHHSLFCKRGRGEERGKERRGVEQLSITTGLLTQEDALIGLNVLDDRPIGNSKIDSD